MIWGEVIDVVRRFHFDLVQQAPILLKPHPQDLNLDLKGLVFPIATDAMDDWSPDPLPANLAEWLEFHPVERALLEGPLLPIQGVRFASENELHAFTTSVVGLELAWLKSTGRMEQAPANWETEFKSRLLRLQTLAGFRRLRQA